jgi:hypothetical protein
MSKLARRLRALLIALAVLVLSATAALAGRSALSGPASQTAAQHADGDEQGEAETGNAEEPEADAPDSDADEDADTDEGDAGAGAGEAAAEHPDNHGKAVSEAAQGETPAGFDNHGAYVRTVAHDHGAAGSTKAPKAKGKGHSH